VHNPFAFFALTALNVLHSSGTERTLIRRRKMKRRRFLQISGQTGAVAVLGAETFLMFVAGGCARKLLQSADPPPDIVLVGDANKLSKTVSQGFRLLADAAQGKRDRVRVGFVDQAGKNQTVVFSAVKKGGVAYTHPLLESSNSGSAHLVGGGNALAPSLKLVDADGKTLHAENRKPLEFNLDIGDIVSLLRAAPEKAGREIKHKVIAAAVKAVAVLLILWLGLSIAKPIIGALATIALALLLLALVAARFGKLDEGLTWIFEKTGISFLDIQEFFGKAGDALANLLRETADFAEQRL